MYMLPLGGCLVRPALLACAAMFLSGVVIADDRPAATPTATPQPKPTAAAESWPPPKPQTVREFTLDASDIPPEPTARTQSLSDVAKSIRLSNEAKEPIIMVGRPQRNPMALAPATKGSSAFEAAVADLAKSWQQEGQYARERAEREAADARERERQDREDARAREQRVFEACKDTVYTSWGRGAAAATNGKDVAVGVGAWAGQTVASSPWACWEARQQRNSSYYSSSVPSNSFSTRDIEASEKRQVWALWEKAKLLGVPPDVALAILDKYGMKQYLGLK